MEQLSPEIYRLIDGWYRDPPPANSINEKLYHAFRNLYAPGPQAFGVYDGREHRSLHDYAGNNHLVDAALQEIYGKVIKSKREFILDFDRIKTFYIVQALIGSVIEDALTPSIADGEILTLSSGIEEIDEELQKFSNRFNIDQIINDFTPDLLANGEYTLALQVVQGEGVVDIRDDIDQTKIVGLYHQGFPYKFLRQTEIDIEVFEPFEYAHFVFGSNRLRIRLENEFFDLSDMEDDEGEDFPTYARIGRPLLYGVLSKIKELMLLEQLIPATKLNQFLTGGIVSVSVPPGMAPDEAFNIARHYEQILNAHQAVNRATGELSVADIIGLAGKIRTIPVWDNKGQLTNINDVKDHHAVDELLGSITDIRGVICTSIGMPPEILFGGIEGQKAEFLKRYSRYLRRLRATQRSITYGIRQIALAHLANCKKPFKNIKITDIDVTFANHLLNVDELEGLEFEDALINEIDTVDNFVEKLRQRNPQLVNETKYQQWLHNKLQVLGDAANFVNSPEDTSMAHVENPLPATSLQSQGMDFTGAKPSDFETTPPGEAPTAPGTVGTTTGQASSNGTLRPGQIPPEVATR
jgi:hypothetical protein